MAGEVTVREARKIADSGGHLLVLAVNGRDTPFVCFSCIHVRRFEIEGIFPCYESASTQEEARKLIRQTESFDESGFVVSQICSRHVRRKGEIIAFKPNEPTFSSEVFSRVK
jgi:hypothetical protein